MTGAQLVDTLYPQTAERVREAIAAWEKAGLTVGITSAYRSFREQAVLYRAHQAGGPQATAPGHSFHNVRRAIDFVPLTAGQPDFGPSGGGPASDAYWELLERVALIGEGASLEWGGRWKGRKQRDGYHLQDTWCQACGIYVGSSEADHFNESGSCAVNG